LQLLCTIQLIVAFRALRRIIHGASAPPGRRAKKHEEFVAVPRLPEGTNALAVWPKQPPANYLGQLEPEFQERFASWWQDVKLEDCYFYHRVRLRDGKTIDGVWNLLGCEAEYLGGVKLRGRRVLELGPATGWLTTWMEQQGADVVGFDLGWELAPDLLPLAQFDGNELRAGQVEFVSRVTNSWWLLHREHELSAKAIYGSIYDLPADIGQYDISIFGAILLHLRDPFLALQQVARRTDEAIVVVEPLAFEIDQSGHSLARWNPTQGRNPNGWWNHSPGELIDMLKVLGFPRATVTYHRQEYRPESDPTSAHVEAPMFTVVASRD
jgi:O-methyltransferase